MLDAAVDEWVRAGERRQRRSLLAGTITLVVATLVVAKIASIAFESNAAPANEKHAIESQVSRRAAR